MPKINAVDRAAVAAYAERDGWESATGEGRVAQCQSCARALPTSRLTPVHVNGPQTVAGTSASGVLIVCRKCKRYYEQVGRA